MSPFWQLVGEEPTSGREAARLVFRKMRKLYVREDFEGMNRLLDAFEVADLEAHGPAAMAALAATADFSCTLASRRQLIERLAPRFREIYKSDEWLQSFGEPQ